jgi:uncharacterized protein DUF2283
MQITYHPEADALYVGLRDVPAEDAVKIEEGVTVDLVQEVTSSAWKFLTPGIAWGVIPSTRSVSSVFCRAQTKLMDKRCN